MLLVHHTRKMYDPDPLNTLSGSTGLDLKGHELVIAPHEGIVSADIWLKCRYMLMNTKAFHDNKKPKNTWQV